MSPPPIPDRIRGTTACPLCDAPAMPAHAPFCSQGCRDRDLLNWLGEGYRMAGRPAGPNPSPDSDDG